MRCDYYEADLCKSCKDLHLAPSVQLAEKQDRVAQILSAHVPAAAWVAPQASAEEGFRNKAKLAVGGSSQQPTLGIMLPDGKVQDLLQCPLYDSEMRAYLAKLPALLAALKLPPYELNTRRGELKYVLVTQSPKNRFMLRLVLRSKRLVPQIRQLTPAILQALPGTEVFSLNFLPEHVALTEGHEELLLTEQKLLPMPLRLTFANSAGGEAARARAVGDVPQTSELVLYARPGGFFQTNTQVAQALYQQAADWAADYANGQGQALDLFCGVGGFALAMAAGFQRVFGVEISESAVLAARASAQQAGLENVSFEAADAQSIDMGAYDLVVVNPPRRGIGPELCQWLSQARPAAFIYSSCNPQSLAEDLGRIEGYRVLKARLFDMFPHTDHAEVLVLAVAQK
ncbi:hypothetical protein BSR28_08525 [Boudabousia liubingyangii]|uniref:methyltransferase domain-containing protein n=1 Tax=Boudabousia liubingyangii TaxID=1921764 RepID=UPI0009389230|nr:methyltransferase domain-containing protein [Boudabousia liubingyangii]OKL46093.1 hypothetical protein BSR28_08525 [Boudabousia liubingyangii]